MKNRRNLLFACAASLASVIAAGAQGQNAGGQAPAAPAPTPRAAAPVDFTGQWVSLISEDWRFRMVTPSRGDYQSIPMTPEAIKIADAWDPKADQTAGVPCKSYGAPVIMHTATRIRISWQDDRTLKMETDYGTQTRLFHFDTTARPIGQGTWQGNSTATWETGRGRGGAAAGGPLTGSLTVVTKNLRSGYLRKNGIPYSENAVLTEYFDVAPMPGVGQVLVVTAAVDDTRFLDRQYVVASQFKKEADTSKWDPTPCSAEW